MLMKDLVTGLPIASIQHLPQQLQDALLRGQRNVTPLVFFAETARKLSQSAHRRYEKERLIVITPDALNVYGIDGAIKRRVKIAEITAVLYTKMTPLLLQGHGSAKKSSDSVPSSGSGSSSGPPPRGFEKGKKATASVGLRVPSQYDLAFDLISRDDGGSAPLPLQIINNLIRVISVLQSVSSSNNPSSLASSLAPPSSQSGRSGARVSGSPGRFTELRVLLLDSAPSGSSNKKQLWDHLTLKKTPLSSRSQARQQQLLAPILPLVTEDSERQKQQDAKLQVDEAIADLLEQLERYTNESVYAKTAAHLQRLEAYCDHLQAMENGEFKNLMKERWLRGRSAKLDQQQTVLQQHLSVAREAQLSWIRKIEVLRNNHEETIRRIRSDVAECDGRAEDLEKKIRVSEESQVLELFHLDSDRKGLEDNLRRAHQILESRELLPTAGGLLDEISALKEASEKLHESLDRERQRVAKETEIVGLRSKMLEENAVLEKELAEHMAALRTQKEKNMQLALKVSLALARRNRLLASCQASSSAVAAIVSECAALEHRSVAQQQTVDLLTQERELLESEQLVVSDMAREALMHDSITASVATIAISDERMKISSEAALRGQLDKLKRLKETLADRITQIK